MRLRRNLLLVSPEEYAEYLKVKDSLWFGVASAVQDGILTGTQLDFGDEHELYPTKLEDKVLTKEMWDDFFHNWDLPETGWNSDKFIYQTMHANLGKVVLFYCKGYYTC